MTVKNDAFYTKKSVAKELIALIEDIYSYSIIIEPSAGDGSFSSQINNCLAFDIDPKNKKIKKQDFLKLDKIPNVNPNDKLLFVGNPPFGKRSSLAKSFIKQCIKLNASTIAFILPDIFSKPINQKYNLFPKEWKLIKEEKLSDNSFEIKKGKTVQDYFVPCSFYVWTKLPSKINLRRCSKPVQPKEWVFLKRGSSSADFTINGNSGKIKKLNEVTNSKSEHYIKVNNGFSKTKIKKIFQQLKFSMFSSVNGKNWWINQEDIINAWNNFVSSNKLSDK